MSLQIDIKTFLISNFTVIEYKQRNLDFLSNWSQTKNIETKLKNVTILYVAGLHI